MKTFLIAIGLLLSIGSAWAAQSDDSPQAQACMQKYGFTLEQWHARTVPASKANPYRLCRDSGGRADAGKVKAKCLAEAGVTPAQWQAMKASESQGAAYKACMASNGIDVTVHRRNGSSF